MAVKPGVLFVCVHNSARSQMAEAFLRQLAGDRFEVASAGMEPTGLNPLAIEVMKEVGLDISGNTAKSVFNLFNEGKSFQYVITVCDESSSQGCPYVPGITTRLHWSFVDPAAITGTPEEKLAATRKVRDDIRRTIQNWLSQL
ncbi:MAG: arsenate reductase ArsC [Deltaproteobacteria bacterium]|nr:arsenate reductase ArsC [Deltaproteobacteria bacterium]